jgi:hypothetical protein
VVKTRISIYRHRIEAELGPIIESGFDIAYARDTPEVFGNTEIVLVSDKYKIRFLSDKAEYAVDVANVAATRWYDLAELIRAEGIPQRVGPWESPKAMVDALVKYADVIPTWIQKHSPVLVGRT